MLPEFRLNEIVRHKDTEFYLHDQLPMGEWKGTTVTETEKATVAREGWAESPHFYKWKGKFFVPDGNNDHECTTRQEATDKLREVIADLMGVA